MSGGVPNQSEDEASDLRPAVNRGTHRGCLPATVAIEGHVVGQCPLQLLEVAVGTGAEESICQGVPLRLRGLEPSRLLMQAGPSAAEQLPAIGLRSLNDRCDVVVAVAERLAKDE